MNVLIELNKTQYGTYKAVWKDNNGVNTILWEGCNKLTGNTIIQELRRAVSGNSYRNAIIRYLSQSKLPE